MKRYMSKIVKTWMAVSMMILGAGVAQGQTIGGAVFGGGRMADVDGNTVVKVYDCDTVSAVYGGNDIAGTVNGANGSTITIGHADHTTAQISIGSVYGGGNGYYAYNGTSFQAASDSYNSQTVSPSSSIKAMTQAHQVGEIAWTNNGVANKDLLFPSISKTSVTVNTDYPRIDSLFGGAKNAFISLQNNTNTTLAINGGVMYSVFGGNNFGGFLGDGSTQSISVTNTLVDNTTSVNLGGKEQYGHAWTSDNSEHGIRYLFGGGNKVAGKNVVISVTGGQIDTLFAGGNSADVTSTTVTVNVTTPLYDLAHSPYHTTPVAYNPVTSVFDIRCLFGGNNAADMAGMPTLTLTRGGIHNVYGGGNQGIMMAAETYSDNYRIEDSVGVTYYGSAYTPSYTDLNGKSSDQLKAKRSTNILVNSANFIADTIYGGGQSAGTIHDTYVEIAAGNVGVVYGGTNIMGRIGPFWDNSHPLVSDPRDIAKTNVYIHGGTVHNAVFGGSNGYYRCHDGEVYSSAATNVLMAHQYDNTNDNGPDLRGKPTPAVFKTYVLVSEGATIKGNVFSSGNMAAVGKPAAHGGAPELDSAGIAILHIIGGTIGTGAGDVITSAGAVYGGGNMGNVFGGSDLRISGDNTVIYGDVYGGNNKTGRIFSTLRNGASTPSELAGHPTTAAVAVSNSEYPGLPNISTSSPSMNLTNDNASTYTLITETPKIWGALYGGGNGDYEYVADYNAVNAYTGPKEAVVNGCNTYSADQNSSFVDVNLSNGGYVAKVFGGGNSKTVGSSELGLGQAMVYMNCANVPEDNTDNIHVGSIFGGNNNVDMAKVPRIALLQGKTEKVYGGGNLGRMTGGSNQTLAGFNLSTYVALASDNIVITKDVYAGCNAADVLNHTYVIMRKGKVLQDIFGGNDAAGEVGISHVLIDGVGASTQVRGSVYGGGNGNYAFYEYEGTEDGKKYYDFNGTRYYSPVGATNNYFIGEKGATTLDIFYHNIKGRPFVDSSAVVLTGNMVLNNVYGGGISGDCRKTNVVVDAENGVINGMIFGAGKGRVDNMGVRITGGDAPLKCKSLYTGIAQFDGSGDIVYGTGTAMGNVLDTAFLTIRRFKEMNGPRAAIFGGGQSGHVGTTYVVYENTATSPLRALYLGCLASDVKNEAVGIINAYEPAGEQWIIDTIYGGNDFTGRVESTNLTINSGSFTHIFGAGNGDVSTTGVDYDGTRNVRYYKEWVEKRSDLYDEGDVLSNTNCNCYDTVPYSMNVKVTINGGIFLNTIYGGGNMGLVGDRDMTRSEMVASNATRDSKIGNIELNIHDGIFHRHVFTGARGKADMKSQFFDTWPTGSRPAALNVDGGELGKQLTYAHKVLNMDGGHVMFSVYGGSEAVDDGFPYECIGAVNGDATPLQNTTLRPTTILNITGGRVSKSVYGGGYQGNIYGSVYVNIGVDAVRDCPVWNNTYNTVNMAEYKPNLPVHSGYKMTNTYEGGTVVKRRVPVSWTAPAGNTPLVANNIELQASVYNASDWGEAGSKAYFDTRGVFGGVTNILIDGKGYYTSLTDPLNVGLPTMDIAYSIIGAGTSTDGGDVNKLITLRHYGDYDCEPSKKIYSIQRANKVILDSAFIWMYGEQDAYSAYTSPSYSFCRIDTLIFRVDNVVLLDAPGLYVSNLASLRTDEVYNINQPTEIYSKNPVDPDSRSSATPIVANDFIDNLWGTPGEGENCTENACNNISACDKVDVNRGKVGKPAAYNMLMMRNGSYLKISPFVDVTGGPGNTPDGIDDGNHAFGGIYGWMFFMTQDASMSYVYASVKEDMDNMAKGGFVATCYCDNFKDNFDNEIVYINVDANDNGSLIDNDGDYRTWKVGERQGPRTRHIALVANVKPDTRLNNELVGTSIPIYQANANGVTSQVSTRTVTIGNELGGDSLAYATTVLELPPADGGSFYVLNSVSIDQDNGGQMTLIEEGYEAKDNIFFKSNDAGANEIGALRSDPNYTFGLVFSGDENFDNVTPNWNDGNPSVVRTDEFERQLIYGSGNTPYETWKRCVISGNDNLTIAGGFISKAIISTAQGAIPTMQFTLTYHKRLSTTITRDVNFTFYEFDKDGNYVGPVNVTVTISTVIKDFSDLEAPVVAMFNEGITNEYVRKITIPAGFLQRDIYIEGVEWGKDDIDNAPNTVATDPLKADWFHMQEMRPDNTPPQNNNHFSFIVTPTENTTETSNNTLGWYHIEQEEGIDLYKIAKEDWERTEAINDAVTGNWNSLNRDILYNSWDCMGNESYIRTDMGGVKGKGIWLGTLDGRSTASIDVKLNFNGLWYYHDQYTTPLAWVKLKCHYYNTKTEGEGEFEIRIKLRTRKEGDTIYLAPEVLTLNNVTGLMEALPANQRLTRTAVASDGTSSQNFTVHAYGYGLDHENEIQTGPYPNYNKIREHKNLIKNNPDKYLTNFKKAMDIYDEGDVLCILETMPITNGVEPISIMGDDYGVIQIIRYSGSHYKFPTLGCANPHAMIEVKNNGILSMRNIWINGSGCTRTKQERTAVYAAGNHSSTIAGTGANAGTTYYYYEDDARIKTLLWSQAPMIYVHGHGQVSMIKNVRMTNNFSNVDIATTNAIGGGAVAVVRDDFDGAVPSFVFGDMGMIYDNVILDYAAANNYGTGYETHQPHNYGAAAYIDGGHFTLGTGTKNAEIQIARNFYLKSNNATTTGIRVKTAHVFADASETSTQEIDIELYHLDTLEYSKYFALSNIYLTRKAGSVTVPDNPATTDVDESTYSRDHLIRYDNQSDVVYFLSEMTPTSSVGISKWFPGYAYVNTAEPHYLDNPTDRIRDTIMVARIGKGKSNTSLVDINYAAGVFFNDSSFTASNNAVAEGNPAFISNYPAVAYSYTQSTDPYTYNEGSNVFNNYNDNVFIFRHTSLAPYNIYFQRCASFKKGIKQELETMGSFVHLMEQNPSLQFNNYVQGDSIAYHWNPDATCALTTDTIRFHVGGGFFPYTYTWYDISDGVSEREIQTRQTIGSNAISRFGVPEYEKLRNSAQFDTLVMRLSVNTSGESANYAYRVRANDITGNCTVEQDVKVKVTKVATDHHDGGKFLYDYDNFLLHRKNGALPNWQNMSESELDAARAAQSEKFYRIEAPGVDSSSFHDRVGSVPLHDHEGSGAEGGLCRAGYTHTDGCSDGHRDDFLGKPYLGDGTCADGDMTPRYIRLFRSFRVKPSIYPVAARGDIDVKNANDDLLYHVVTADMNNDSWSPSVEVCPGEILHFEPTTSTTNNWEFIGWDFNPSSPEDASFVVTNKTEDNSPIIFYVPGDYWFEVVNKYDDSKTLAQMNALKNGSPEDKAIYNSTAYDLGSTESAGNWKYGDYHVDYYGNVTVYSKKGMAWLISMVNGYNGQNAQTFHFNTITLDLTRDGEGNPQSFDMQEHKWTPLGNDNNPFEGVFDGNGNHISNILVNETTVMLVGMFGQTRGATIKDFIVDSTMVRGNSYVSAIVGEAKENTIVDNVTIQRGAIFGEYCIGGFISRMNNSTLSNCRLSIVNYAGEPINTATVDAGRISAYGNGVYAGGFVGLANGSTLINNRPQRLSYIDISKLSAIYVGALLGYNKDENPQGGKNSTRTKLNNNYARIMTSDKAQRVGGLVGYAEDIEMNNNYVHGNLDYNKQYGYVGGIAGYIGNNVSVSNCYYIEGLAENMVGVNLGTMPMKSTTFTGTGNQVILRQTVDGYTNLTRVLNAWVRDNGDTIYKTWRSDLDGENHGLPLFGEPDLIPVNDTLETNSCHVFEYDGLTFDQSGTYVFHIVDSSDFVDSTLTLILTINQGDSTFVSDSVDLGQAYNGFGLQFSDEDIRAGIAGQGQRDVYTFIYIDSLINANGCDSLVYITLYVVNKNNETPQVTSQLTDVKVYPNPTRGLVNVEGSDLQSVEVYDNVSRRVLLRSVDGDSMNFDLSNHPAGTYYVRVRTAHGTVVKKVVKK